jgi:hypothetical protein
MIEVTSQTISRWETGVSTPRLAAGKRILELWKASFTTSQEEEDFDLEDYAAVVRLEDNGRRANIRMVRTIVANVPMSEYLWQLFSEGKVGNVSVSPGRVIYTFRHAGNMYQIHDLGRRLEKGESLRTSIEWETLDSFQSNHEWVAFRVDARTKHFKIRICFPRARPPRSSSITGQLRGLPITVESPIVTEAKRRGCDLLWEVKDPELGALYTITWGW